MVQSITVSGWSDPAFSIPDVYNPKLTYPPSESWADSPNPVTLTGGQHAVPDPQRQSTEELSHHIQQMIESLVGGKNELSVAVDPETKKIIVKIVNSETGEVIRQIPPEEVVKMAAALKKISGSIFDEVV